MLREYKLVWPVDEPRTPATERRTSSPFTMPADRTIRLLAAELVRFKARNVVLSTNDTRRSEPRDPGAALYFSVGPRKVSINVDLFAKTADNVRAIGKIVEAMRMMERYGGSKMSDKAFTGFAALAPPLDCWKILGISKGVGEALSPKMRREFVLDAFRQKAKEGHTDVGGGGNDMGTLVKARDDALLQLGAA